MDKRAIIVLSIVFGGLFLVFFGFLALAITAMEGEPPPLVGGTGPKVGVVEVKDVIQDAKPTLEQLREFRDDDSIEAVIVRIDSPGGAVAPSQEIHDAILKLREKKKVVASMANVAASGGYYVAVACDEIVANPGTLTASIGVITQLPRLQELAHWAKIDFVNITSGKLKDAGDPFSDLTEEDRAYFQGLVMDIHAQFVKAVAEGRGMSEAEVSKIADGRAMTGAQAKEAGLVDYLGNFEFAVERVRELAGLEEEPRLVYPKKSEEDVLRELLRGGAKGLAQGLKTEAATTARGFGAQVLFLMAPLAQ
ncbi:MAG: signal peptide peptidase SppA [Deltaproteobacteria bacterium]|nr:MAG: signal peptide peptidase SppA [Deltaproteobacteria bacterium]